MPAYIPINQRSPDDRPREKFLQHGEKILSNAELLGILLSTGTKNRSAVDLAGDILKTVENNLNQLARCTVGDLCRIDGIGPAKAIIILVAIELGARKSAATVEEAKRIGSSRDAYQYMAHDLADKSYEEFWILLLNRANRIIRKSRISEGSISGTVADPRKIYKIAIDQGASNLILCHNHPSGNLQPSEADIQLTKKMKEAGQMLDIQVLDHLIIASGGYYSFADEGLM